jgi:fibronectin type 3 domain-containing protein
VNWTQGGTAVSTNPTYGFAVSANRTLAANFAVIGTPSLNAPVSAGYSSIKLTWPAVTGAKAYYVYRAATIKGAYSKISTVTGLTYTDTGLTCGTTYYYKIQAYCVAGSTTTVSPFSGVKSATPVLPLPANVKAAKASSTSAKVSWSAAAGAEGYEVSRASSIKGTYSPLGTASALYYTSTRLTHGATYYFKVRAYCTVGKTKVYSGYSVIVSYTPQ